MVVLASLTLGVTGASAASPPRPPRITIAVVPQGTGPGRLARIEGMAVGLMSAGIGSVPPAQTYIDMGQGNRVSSSLYDEPLPLLDLRPGVGGGPARVPPPLWRAVRQRAADAPADLAPGLLGSTLRLGGVAARADPLAGGAGVALADRRGRVASRGACPAGPCPRASLTEGDPARVAAMARRLRGHDLLIAVERPPPPKDRQATIGIAGRGFGGTLTSDSTRMRGYVVSTDLAPTILERLGLTVPAAVSGQPIRAEGEADPEFLRRLEDRLAVIGPRRGPVIGQNMLIWTALAALAGIAFGARGLRAALPLLAVTVAWLPAVLLLTAALEPSGLAERLIAGVGSPALALLTLRLASGAGALAIAGAASVLGYAIDVVAGSTLTELSVMGPNPAGGVRFYGIGNELEATVAALVPMATGAALAAWAPRISRRGAAATFLVTGALAVAAFALGRFGADVGAAIAIPVGVAAAVVVCLGGGRRRLVVGFAAPFVALAALAAADLLLGGDSHLTRSVLRAGGLDQLAEVAERRLRLSASSFRHYATTPALWIALALIAAGVAQRRRIEGWLADRPLLWAGFLGALAATLAGTLANDSGAVFLIVGSTLATLCVGLAWATRVPSPSGARRPEASGRLR